MKIWTLLLLAGVAHAATLHYWVEPCTNPETGCHAADPELAQWALEAWQQAAGPGLRFVAVDGQIEARIRVYWLDKRPQLYGDTRMVYLNGKRGWDIEVNPDLSQFGPRIAAAAQSDKLFRDTVVYLTCLHEAGHALALPHTADFADIMYSFQYGGDVLEYFNRYRRILQQRPDIRAHPGISAADSARVAGLYTRR